MISSHSCPVQLLTPPFKWHVPIKHHQPRCCLTSHPLPKEIASPPRQAEALCHEMIGAAGSIGQRIQLRKENALLGVRRLAAEVEAQKAPAFDLCFIDADKELGSGAGVGFVSTFWVM